MSEYVAVEGMTAETTSTNNVEVDVGPAGEGPSGNWVNVTFVVIKGTKLSVDNDFVEFSATATWSYVGGYMVNPAAPPPYIPLPPIPDSASLTASTTILKDTNTNLLLVGDKATGTADADNYIEVESGQTKLKTS